MRIYITNEEDFFSNLLEVSGVDKGPTSVILQRLRTKLEQAKVGGSNLPAIAGVVGFRERLVLIQRLVSEEK